MGGKVLSFMRSSNLPIHQSAQVNIVLTWMKLLYFDFSRIKNVLHSAYFWLESSPSASRVFKHSPFQRIFSAFHNLQNDQRMRLVETFSRNEHNKVIFSSCFPNKQPVVFTKCRLWFVRCSRRRNQKRRGRGRWQERALKIWVPRSYVPGAVSTRPPGKNVCWGKMKRLLP